jgi:hypothetical protein
VYCDRSFADEAEMLAWLSVFNQVRRYYLHRASQGSSHPAQPSGDTYSTWSWLITTAALK